MQNETINVMVRRAAIYVRVSTDKQEEDGTSLVTQLQKCLEYCQQKGYIVADIHIYRDVWTGAEYRERPELSRLREAARKHEFDVIVFYAFDRLSRNQVHQAVIIDDLQYNDLTIECVTENFDDSALGQFMRSAHGFAAELEREKIRERSHRGMMNRFQEGKLAGGGLAAYGYKWTENRTAWLVNHDPIRVDGIVKIDENGEAWTEARIIKRIFSMVDAGMPHRRVIAILTEEGIPTKRGRQQWQLSTLYHILTNRLYTGQGAVNRWKDIKRPGMSPKLVRKPLEEQMPLAEGTIPAIIDIETFERVQYQMQRNKKMAARNSKHVNVALLRCGLVICGNCQEVMHVQQINGSPFYSCRKTDNQIKHKSPGIKAEILDAAAWEFVVKSLKDEALIQNRVEKLKGAIQDGTQQELEPVTRKMEELQQEQENLALSISQIDRNKPEHRHAISSLTALIQKSSASMEQLEKEKKAIMSQRESIVGLEMKLEKYKIDCLNIGRGIENILTYEEKRNILEVLGFRATVWEYRHDPRYKCELIPPILYSKTIAVTVSYHI